MNATYEESRIQLLAPEAIDEKWAAEQDELVNSCGKKEDCCHARNASRRAKLLRAVVLSVAASLFIILSFAILAATCPGVHSLLKRQSTDNSNNDNNTFVNDHLWIIIVCVVGNSYAVWTRADHLGVVLCLLLAICVAGCCCQESFRNPICCPCYTLACCGCLGTLVSIR
jgi:hypothetical protein